MFPFWSLIVGWSICFLLRLVVNGGNFFSPNELMKTLMAFSTLAQQPCFFFFFWLCFKFFFFFWPFFKRKVFLCLHLFRLASLQQSKAIVSVWFYQCIVFVTTYLVAKSFCSKFCQKGGYMNYNYDIFVLLQS